MGKCRKCDAQVEKPNYYLCRACYLEDREELRKNIHGNICTRCHEESEIHNKYMWMCDECTNLLQSRAAFKHKLKRVGLSEDRYFEMLDDQGWVCAICGGELVGRLAHLDHDHATGKARGVLCQKCNLMLGNARDNIEILNKAINYLTKGYLK